MAYADNITITYTHTSTSAAKKYIQLYLYTYSFCLDKTKQSYTKPTVGNSQGDTRGKRRHIRGSHVLLSRPNTAGYSTKQDGGAKKKQYPDKNGTSTAVKIDTLGEHTDSGLVCKSCRDFFVDNSAKIHPNMHAYWILISTKHAGRSQNT